MTSSIAANSRVNILTTREDHELEKYSTFITLSMILVKYSSCQVL
jgi:hypothetical protein